MSDISAKIMSIETADEGIAAQTRKAPPATPAYEAPSGYLWVTITIWICALLWVIGVFVIAHFTADSNGLSGLSAPLIIAVSAAALIPAGLILLLGLMTKRVLTQIAGTQAIIRATESLTRPDSAAQARVTSLAQGIRSQIIGVDAELKAALDRLAGMENVLRGHTDALASSHLASTRQTDEIANRLSEEREGLKQISSNFDERMGALSRLLTEHSDRLAQATQIAEQKIQEARVSVEGAAAKINASSEVVRDNALAATDSLSVGETKIASLAEAIKTQATSLDEINARHAADMGALVESLRDEQERMRETMDARLEAMRNMSLSAKLSADHLNEAGDAGRRTIEALAQSADLADTAVRERFKEMEEMVNFSASKAETITDRAARRVRDSMSLTRLEISRIEDDMRELEQRLTTHSLDFERRDSAVDVTPKSGWRKSLLRFRPAEPDETPQDEPATEPAKLTLTAPPGDDAPKPAPTPNQNLDIPHPRKIRDEDVKPAPTLSTPAVNGPGASEMLTPDVEAPAAPRDPVLPIDMPQVPSLSAERIDAPQLRRRADKSGWSLKSIFGGGGAAPKPQVQSLSPQDWDSQCKAMIGDLSELGLAPAATVEAGTIIEAVNMRVSQGADAMRKTVALRLHEPVTHLQGQFSQNADLRSKADKFAGRFYQVIAAHNGEREAIRTELETDAGRAFLLCDAALG